MSIINALGNVAIASGNLIHFSNGQLLLNSHSYSQNILFFFGRKLFQDEQKLRNQINGLKVNWWRNRLMNVNLLLQPSKLNHAQLFYFFIRPNTRNLLSFVVDD